MICIKQFSEQFPGFQAFQIKKGRIHTLSVRREGYGEHVQIDEKTRGNMSQWLVQQGYPKSLVSATNYQ